MDSVVMHAYIIIIHCARQVHKTLGLDEISGPYDSDEIQCETM